VFEPDQKINFFLFKEYGISNEKEMLEFYEYLDNISMGVLGNIDFNYNSDNDDEEEYDDEYEGYDDGEYCEDCGY
jgi:archaellum component FlaD/FlaE